MQFEHPGTPAASTIVLVNFKRRSGVPTSLLVAENVSNRAAWTVMFRACDLCVIALGVCQHDTVIVVGAAAEIRRNGISAGAAGRSPGACSAMAARSAAEHAAKMKHTRLSAHTEGKSSISTNPCCLSHRASESSCLTSSCMGQALCLPL